MKDYFAPGKNQEAPLLFMLHGTGGTEMDLIHVAQTISPQSSILSVRGNVKENGMPRFFKRISEGMFDIEDLKFRTNELHEYLKQAAAKYGFDRQNVVAVGYSNGANIAASMMFHYKDAFRGAILHHPMVPLRDHPLPNLQFMPIWIGAGENDPICEPAETEELAALFKEAGADVSVHWENYGHRLTTSEVSAAAKWFKEKFN